MCVCPGVWFSTARARGQGLGQLLIGAPRLMLLADQHGVVGAALAKGAGDEVLVQALR